MSFTLSSDYQGKTLLNEPLSKHCYYRIGGPADVLVIPKTRDDLLLIAAELKRTKLPYFVMGMGSNLLISDDGFRGVVIKASAFDYSVALEREEGETLFIRTGASASISNLLREGGAKGWGGFELWTGIPGSIGGAIAMNAGTHLGESESLLVETEWLDLETGDLEFLKRDQIEFGYRENKNLKSSQIILSALWRATKTDPEKLKALIADTLARRKATQPIDFPSCGSVFRNPYPKRSWEVLEELGLRGHQIGQAEFSSKHPNFIVNLGGAKAADVRALIQLAKDQAQAKLSISLHEEVKYLGF